MFLRSFGNNSIFYIIFQMPPSIIIYSAILNLEMFTFKLIIISLISISFYVLLFVFPLQTLIATGIYNNVLSENTENVEKTRNTENVKKTHNTENVEKNSNTENVKKTRNTENVEKTRNTENIKKTRNTENTEDIMNNEDNNR